MAREKNFSYTSYDEAENISIVGNYVWDTGTLAWIKAVPSGGGGGGGLSDAELRATPVPVSGTFFQATQPVSGTFFQATQPVSGPLTDAQLRAVPVPVSGTVNVGTVPVTGPLTDTQLRATPVPVSGTVTATGPLTDTQLRAVAVPVSGSFFQVTQPVSGTFFQVTQPVSAAALPLPAGASTEATLATRLSETDFDTKTGSLTEAAPASDTASSGLNGRLQRIAQRLTSMIALLPAALVGGRLDVNNGTWLGSTAPTVAQKTMANSVPVVIASDQTAVPVSGTVTITPPTLTKGTQGATGESTQDLKDAGRNQTNYYMVIQIVTTATDALLALTGYKGGILVAATTTPAVVTAAKTYRINSITMEYTSIVTTEGSVRFTLRANLSGVVAIGSPVVCVWEVGQPGTGVSVAGKKNTIVFPFPDGLEFPAGTGIGVSQVGLSPVGAAAIAGYGRVSIQGFEY